MTAPRPSGRPPLARRAPGGRSASRRRLCVHLADDLRRFDLATRPERLACVNGRALGSLPGRSVGSLVSTGAVAGAGLQSHPGTANRIRLPAGHPAGLPGERRRGGSPAEVTFPPRGEPRPVRSAGMSGLNRTPMTRASHQKTNLGADPSRASHQELGDPSQQTGSAPADCAPDDPVPALLITRTARPAPGCPALPPADCRRSRAASAGSLRARRTLHRRR